MNFEGITTKLFLLGNDLDYVLFKLAIVCAQRGLNVWFISEKPIEKVPQDITKPCKEVLQLITFIYLSDFEHLLKHLNGVHKWKHVPNVVILKNFHYYCQLWGNKYDSRSAAFLAAKLVESASYFSRKKQSETLLVVSSCDGEENYIMERLKVLFDMYFDQVLFEKECGRDELIKRIEDGYFK